MKRVRYLDRVVDMEIEVLHPRGMGFHAGPV